MKDDYRKKTSSNHSSRRIDEDDSWDVYATNQSIDSTSGGRRKKRINESEIDEVRIHRDEKYNKAEAKPMAKKLTNQKTKQKAYDAFEAEADDLEDSDDIFYDDYSRNRVKKSQKGKSKHGFGKFLAIIQGILSLIVVCLLFIMGILPSLYLLGITVVFVVLWLFAFFSQYTKKSHIPGKIVAIIMCLVLAFASYYLLITQSMFSKITSFMYYVDNYVVAVLQENPAQSLQDAKDYTFALDATDAGEKQSDAITKINSTLGSEIATVTYNDKMTQVQALYNLDVDAIIYNENDKDLIEEMIPGFIEQTRILESVEIKQKVEMTLEDLTKGDVTDHPFIMYISGNDGYGSLSLRGRSDVNMLVAVNPNTKQILMINTPRDYYVEFPGVSGGQKDKLTHAGNYGIDCSVRTLEQIYDEEIDYYCRVNFSSLIKMVDALGGITVNADYAFKAGNKQFAQGPNELNGEEALAFSRERYSLEGGDFQRGRNQQLVLMGMIQKATSPAVLTGYAGIISSLSDSFATNMPQTSITDLIKMQLEEGGQWNMVTMSVTGQTDMQICYSAPGQPLSVVIPNDASVLPVREMIDRLYAGETLVQPEIKIMD